MKDITLLIAHADDELLFAWPILDRVKRIVCVSSDENNPSRAWCGKRKYCLQEVAERIGAEVTQFAFDSEFYRLETRNGTLKSLMNLITDSVAIDANLIFTHNSWGEYFNLDHLICHHIGRLTGLPMLVSDMAIEVNWGPVIPYPQGELISRHKLDRDWFDELKHIYDARGCWTWSHEPVTEAGLYRDMQEHVAKGGLMIRKRKPS